MQWRIVPESSAAMLHICVLAGQFIHEVSISKTISESGILRLPLDRISAPLFDLAQ